MLCQSAGSGLRLAWKQEAIRNSEPMEAAKCLHTAQSSTMTSLSESLRWSILQKMKRGPNLEANWWIWEAGAAAKRRNRSKMSGLGRTG